MIARPGAAPQDDLAFEGGRRLVRVGGFVAINGPPARIERLRPGLYVLEARSYLKDAGNQRYPVGTTVTRTIRILPG